MTSKTSTHSFIAKAVGALLLVLLADWLVYGNIITPAFGIFALGWAAAIAILHKRFLNRWLIGMAAAFALLLIEDPSLLAWLLFGIMLAAGVMLPRMRRFDDAWSWLLRLLLVGVLALAGPFRDLHLLGRLQRRQPGRQWSDWVALLALPLGGGALFLWFFSEANPLIGRALGHLHLSWPNFDTVLRFLFWALVFTMVWAIIRPARFHLTMRSADAAIARALPGISVGSVTLSLLVFNALFALQNGLDLVFLWSGAPLPADVTLADYAHRGAYLLIATALLAGLFVLVALRPGTPMAQNPRLRALVSLWIAQNILLVASSMLRTIDYVQAYSLTVLRLSALLWMLLVAIGLLLICLRLLGSRSTGWLINANALAAGLLLCICSIVDLGEVAARWNVRHAREAGGSGPWLDLCYLNRLGPSALRPLTELALTTRDDAFGNRVRFVRQKVLEQTLDNQKQVSWSWRNQRRLARAGSATIPAARPVPAGAFRACDGAIIFPTPRETAPPIPTPTRNPPPNLPLTNEPAR
ncbi:DUF4173 domain-containing protein [Sandaracinobacter neustonicus]|uniref:DUF4173 domain-containing protein n=1 Tax=Sandaracinobacter neustonicus TaxID=1715348 RepID=A0A501XDY3_9SPHN|nr:DUF4173 domain-containing protein [Sandaracinobacter neustonicus]TPE58573.1 DUF4173 domain-containing protein [Sandaracinobacter neustonicus]